MTRDLPEQLPEGKLIQDALKESGRSVRQVAPLAEISEARWRQLIQGWMPVGPSQVKPQKAPAATLARMAQVVGITAEQLVDVGRDDAAEVLKAGRVPSPATIAGAAPDDEIELIYASKTMTAQQKLDAIRIVLQLRAQVEAEKKCPTTEVSPSNR